MVVSKFFLFFQIMIIESSREIFVRDLVMLKEEISMYSEEKLLWITSGEIKNSAGNLCLHICGNLQHFIGAVLGKTGYVRNRDLEFTKKNVPVKELLKEIKTTASTVESVLQEIKDGDLYKPYPVNSFGEGTLTHYVLLQLLVHLNYHLGQINYHRRLIK